MKDLDISASSYGSSEGTPVAYNERTLPADGADGGFTILD
jgi:hypothetical protein